MTRVNHKFRQAVNCFYMSQRGTYVGLLSSRIHYQSAGHRLILVLIDFSCDQQDRTSSPASASAGVVHPSRMLSLSATCRRVAHELHTGLNSVPVCPASVLSFSPSLISLIHCNQPSKLDNNSHHISSYPHSDILPLLARRSNLVTIEPS